ncbi:hypothetical protein SAMN04488556_4255 [Halostagnicola kamekurae]|uniref:Uncharacterized protein n=1 Tax=Halostagnicola kamekurae TaxID=619731 RepID=A0A1I6V1F9_9EURY|nr:hypothetical protein SAMN04488556_4255 [Halostagnicola kamekurae]
MEELPEFEDSHVILPDRPGHGYRVDSDAREEYAVSFN